MSENTGFGYGTGSADDRANAALGHAEGLRLAIILLMRAIAAGRTGEDMYNDVALGLETEAAKGAVIPGLQSQAKIYELKYLSALFRGPSAQQDEAQ